jgi:hypothetical protein
MPVDDAEILMRVLNDAAFSISRAANVAQINIDTFIAANYGEEFAASLGNLLSGGNSVVAGEVAAFRRSLLRAAAESIFHAFGEGKDEAIIEDESHSDEREYVWTLGASKGGPCPDCSARSGRKETYAYWSEVGLPQSGFSVCGGHCHCSLRPAGGAGDEIKPTKRKNLTEVEKRIYGG